MNIAIIPARGGSKRIPRKNVVDFCGKPLIAWSLEETRNSGLFDHIIVSTDDKEIASVAESYGAEVPFMRPTELADDYTGTVDVISHAVKWAIAQGWELAAVCCIYATAPLIQKSDLILGYEYLDNGSWEYVFSATEFESSVFRSFIQDNSGGIKMLFNDCYDVRSQDMPVVLHDAGQFYWGRPSTWLKKKMIFGKYSLPIIIPFWRVQDIDTLLDMKRAELIFKNIKGILI